MGQKRGQLTIFIIVGLVVLIGIGTVVYVTTKQQSGSLVEERARVEDPTTQLQGIIQDCLRSSAVPLLQQLSSHGGTVKPEFITFKGEKYSIVCNDVAQFGCVNTLRTKRDMADEFDPLLTSTINTCINLDPLKKKGYAIEEQTPATTTSVIGFDDVTIEVKTHIKLSRGADVITFESIADKIQTPLGKLHSLSHVLLNQYSENGYMDKDTWMKEHGASITIMVDRPYPNTVIRLNTTDNLGRPYQYRIAMSGIATAATPTMIRSAQVRLPTCLDNYDCYDNVPEALCALKEGINITPGDVRCIPPFVKSDTCSGKQCNDCMAGDVRVVHGQQWCGTNSVRKDGLDPVGSRFLKMSCIDGNVIVEPCRDFREEFCTEDGGNAGCRLNRWQDCWKQASATDCTNATVRDCFWTSALVPSPRITFEVTSRTNDRCRPLVGVGLEHWTSSGKLVCQIANEQVREEIGVFSEAISWKPPVVHSNGQAQLCYSLGDCGRKRNIVNIGTSKRYKSTTGKPDPALQRTNLTEMLHQPLKILPFQGVPADAFAYPQGDKDYMDQRTQEYIEWWLRQDPIAVLTDQVPLWIRHTAWCKTYKAFKKRTKSRCDACNVIVGGCSEYVCKSLGGRCSYKIDSSGYGSCSYPGEAKALDITLEFPDHEVEKTSEGYRLKEALNPFEKLNVTIKTNTPAVCAFSMIPGWAGESDVEDPDVDAAVAFLTMFSRVLHQEDDTSWTTDYRDPATEEHLVLEAPDLGFVASAFASTGVDIYWAIANPSKLVDELSKKTLGNMAKDSVIRDQIGKLEAGVQSTTSGFEKLIKTDNTLSAPTNTAKYMYLYRNLMSSPTIVTLYLTCEDDAGESAGSEVTLEVPIKSDELPPQIESVAPAPPGPMPPLLSFKLSEPASCGYAYDADASYDDMVPLTCDLSRLSTRTCTMHPDVNGQHSIFVRCRDRPFAFIYGELSIKKTPGLPTTTGGFFIDALDSINYTITPFFRQVTLSIPTDKTSMPLQFNFAEPYVCKWSTTNSTWARMSNLMSCRGQTCAAALDTSADTTYFFICSDNSGSHQNTNKDPYIYQYG